MKGYNLLNTINSPKDLKLLDTSELETLASEIRSFILDVVSVHPGHLGASLGAVELALALHYVYNTPYDVLIWDVGHQAYAHKILTGRKERFYTLRQLGGVSGFPVPEESEYDAFIAGHASTSISALLGMEKAAKLKNETDKKFVAVIGDGGLTGGMAYEALNNAGDSDVLIVLNDNRIAIDKNTSAVGEYLKNLSSKDSKGTFIFENLGFEYSGPVDGHDIKILTDELKRLKDLKGPKLLHVLTTKGKGFKKAEEEQTVFHSPGKFHRETGEILNRQKTLTYPDVFGKTLVRLAEKDNKIVVITPAMITGSSLQEFQRKFPDRIFDVGIAEQHAVTFSAGLAAQGLKPYCVIYSTFLQRAYDQIIHDVALQKLPVVFGVDRAGLVGEDGATHHGYFDLAYMRSIPNMVVAAPMDKADMEKIMELSLNYYEGPFSIRYSKNPLPEFEIKEGINEIGKGRELVKGEKVAIVTIGYAGVLAHKAIKILNDENIFPALYDIRFLKPFDDELMRKVFENFDVVITVEDGTVKGGLADAVSEAKEKYRYCGKIKTLGIQDAFVAHGKRNVLYEIAGYGPNSISSVVREMFGEV